MKIRGIAMAILRILFRRRSSCRLRMMAVTNLVACAFVTVMTLMTALTGFFLVVPVIFKDNERSAFLHRCAIGYLFLNVCGNFLLCVFVDTSTARPVRKPVRQKRKAGTRSASLKATVWQDSSSKPDCVSSELGPSNTGTRKREDFSSRDDNMPANSAVNLGRNVDKAVDTTSNSESCSKSNDKVVKEGVRNDDSGDNKNISCASKDSGSASVLAGNPSSKRQTSETVPTPNTAESQKSSSAEAPKASRRKQQQHQLEPARSHECKLCEKRILRRDHHCFFMTVCIGYHNHKHFIFFCLYMMVGAMYGVILIVRFLHLLYQVRFWGPQTFLFLLLRVVHNVMVKGVVPDPLFCLLLYQMYVCLLVGMAAAGFLFWHLVITANGQTTHEASGGDVRYRRRLTHNLRDVLGRYWPLLLLLPLPLPQAGDGFSYVATSTTTTTTTTTSTTTTTTTADIDIACTPTTGATGKKRQASSAKTGNAATKGGNYGNVDGVRGEDSRSTPTAEESHDSACVGGSPKEESGRGVRERRRGGGGGRGGERAEMGRKKGKKS